MRAVDETTILCSFSRAALYEALETTEGMIEIGETHGGVEGLAPWVMVNKAILQAEILRRLDADEAAG